MSDSQTPLDTESRELNSSWGQLGGLAARVTLLAAAVWAVTTLLRELVHEAVHRLLALEHAGGWSDAGLLAGMMALIAAVRGALMRRREWRKAAADAIVLTRERYKATPSGAREALGVASRKLVATLLTLGGGGSGGLEAPVVLIGQSLSVAIARLTRVEHVGAQRLFQLCGIAAGVSTLLGAPFTASLFALELLYGDRVFYRKLAYALWASVVAFWLNTTLRGYRPLFTAPAHSPIYSLAEYGSAVLVGVAVAIPLAFAFRGVTRWLKRLVERTWSAWHAVLSMLGVAGLAIGLHRATGLGVEHVLGAGEETLTSVFNGDAALAGWSVLLLLVVVRIAAIGLTLAGGGSAGVLFPSMSLGGLVGALVARLVSLTGVVTLDPALFAVVGVAAALTAVVGVPIAAMALVFEVFGRIYGPPTILACGITYIVTLRLDVLREQGRAPWLFR